MRYLLPVLLLFAAATPAYASFHPWCNKHGHPKGCEWRPHKLQHHYARHHYAHQAAASAQYPRCTAHRRDNCTQ